MPATLAALPKGHEFPPTTFTLSTEWVDAYIDAVGDAAIRDAGLGLVPPMAVAALSIRALIEASPLPPGTLHAGQELAFHRAVRIGEELTVAASIVASRRARRLGADERRPRGLCWWRDRDERARDGHVPDGVVAMPAERAAECPPAHVAKGHGASE